MATKKTLTLTKKSKPTMTLTLKKSTPSRKMNLKNIA